MNPWIDIFIRESSKQYMILPEADIGNGDTYIMGNLIADGWEEFCNTYKSFQKCKWFMSKFYPQYALIHYEAQPITFKEAAEFVNRNHRHHISPQGHKFSVAVTDGVKIVGVAIAGRPVSRFKDDGNTIEVTRLCVKPGYKNVCSLLYRKVCRIAKELGYRLVLTYTLESEIGNSLEAAGFALVGSNAGGSWSSKNRYREDKHPTTPKKIWECNLVGS